MSKAIPISALTRCLEDIEERPTTPIEPRFPERNSRDRLRSSENGQIKMRQQVIPTVGQRIGRYELIRELGEGGFGVVYLARSYVRGHSALEGTQLRHAYVYCQRSVVPLR